MLVCSSSTKIFQLVWIKPSSRTKADNAASEASATKSVRLEFVVLEPIELLLFRSVAVGPVLVTKMVIVGVEKQNLPLPSSWGLLR